MQYTQEGTGLDKPSGTDMHFQPLRKLRHEDHKFKDH